MAAIAAILTLWRAWQRRIDFMILWPTLKREARDLEYAKAAFAVHAFNDPAWLCLGEEAIFATIDRLE